MPPPSMTSQSMPPQSMPPPSTPLQSMPPPSMTSQSMPPQSMPPHPMTPQSMPPPSMAPQLMTPQSIAPQSMPLQSMPPQPMTPQSMPPPSMISQPMTPQSIASQWAGNQPQNHMVPQWPGGQTQTPVMSQNCMPHVHMNGRIPQGQVFNFAPSPMQRTNFPGNMVMHPNFGPSQIPQPKGSGQINNVGPVMATFQVLPGTGMVNRGVTRTMSQRDDAGDDYQQGATKRHAGSEVGFITPMPPTPTNGHVMPVTDVQRGGRLTETYILTAATQISNQAPIGSQPAPELHGSQYQQQSKLQNQPVSNPSPQSAPRCKPIRPASEKGS
ncbi:hypothetical protein Cpir12675_006394 [Ceratocystis pirilliformis]|uniref:Uncharacterized protein n=1 Tax=Ceratocystis pirilliformis TaxID=259994 RepID=A0ABR3YHQ5_9PEZI